MLNRRNVSETKLEYTTEQIRHELAEKEALLKANDLLPTADHTESDNFQTTEASQTTETSTIAEESSEADNGKSQDRKLVQNIDEISVITPDQKPNTKENETSMTIDGQNTGTKEPTESKSKKKRRKKSMMKKKGSLTTQSASAPSLCTTSASRKNSSSSSAGSASILPSDQMDFDTDPNQQSSNATSLSIEDIAKSEAAITANEELNDIGNAQDTMATPRICDFHFFSDTEVAASPYGSRPSTPIQSDSEFEISQREKNSDPMTSSTASWKWGEFPITPIKTDTDTVGSKDAKQAERNSTLNTMLSFMKETMRMRKSTSDGGVYLSDLMQTEGLDPDVVAKYFPQSKNESFSNINDGDDHESGNGTSLPHSPSSVENGISKSVAFDFDHDGKLYDK